MNIVDPILFQAKLNPAARPLGAGGDVAPLPAVVGEPQKFPVLGSNQRL